MSTPTRTRTRIAVALAVPLVLAFSTSSCKFNRCADLNKTWPHGVGVPNAVDRSSGPRVTTYFRNALEYTNNRWLDRDGDGIACEQL